MLGTFDQIVVVSIDSTYPGLWHSPRVMLPILTLISLKVGNPTAAVIFLTCLNLPSETQTLIHDVLPCLFSSILREHSVVVSEIVISLSEDKIETLHGNVLYF